MKRFYKLDKLLVFYNEEADKGYYHNPYEYDEKLTAELDKLYPYDSNYERILDSLYYEYEDRIHSVGLMFWEM